MDDLGIPRRAFLARFGRTAMTLAVLGVGGTACGTTTDQGAGADGSEPAGSSAGPSSSPTAAPETETPSSEAGSSDAPPSEPPLQGEMGSDTWRRVKLSIVSAYIVVRGGEAALVDTGTLGSNFTIEDDLATLGLGLSDVGHILITHKHDDHTGSLKAIMTLVPDAVAYAGPEDIVDIETPRPLTPLADGDEVFGLKAIATPGHTAGHFGFLDPAGLLFAGDAINGSAGGVIGPDRRFTADMDAANASVRKLAGLGFDTVLFGHGDPVVGDASTKVEALAASL